MPRLPIIFFLLASAAAFATAGPAVKNAFVDGKGSVHIVTEDGREHTINPEKWQDGGGFTDISVAGDGRTVGWVANQMLTPLQAGTNYGYAVGLEIDVWRDGQIIHKIDPHAQPIRNWIFLKDGEEVAVHTAPLHGQEFYECTRFDVLTGRRLAHWLFNRRNYIVPEWAKPLLINDPLPGPDEVSDWFPKTTKPKTKK